jgi:putative sigma-54 modulation protein
MNWVLRNQIGDRGPRPPAHLPTHIERRLRFALARFGSRVERVIVFLQDRNGPKGGIDKVCRILAKVHGCGSVMAVVTDSDWTVAVDRATTGIGHTVARQLDRVRDRHGRSHRTAAFALQLSFGRSPSA